MANAIRCTYCNAKLIDHVEGKGETWCRRCKRMVRFEQYPSDMSPEVREIESIRLGRLTEHFGIE
jgi:phage FluMu protein Com